MAASQQDVVNEVRESILQALVAFSRSCQGFTLNTDMYVLSRAAMETAERLNKKWERHEDVNLIQV